MRNTSIRPGRTWYDTAGARIHAHGGSVIYDHGSFYWYGENKERSLPGTAIWHWGVRCYRSSDLYNWEDVGLIIPPDLDDTSSPLHPSRQMDRPHIIRHPTTGDYLCWIKVMGEGTTQLTSVLQSPTLTGPYTVIERDVRPLGMDAGDFDLTVDPLTGNGYYFFERVHSELVCADLDKDLRRVSGSYTTHFPNGRPPFVREAPSYFRRNDRHYLVTSGTTWYFPNPSEVATATDYHGPWTVLGDPHGDPLRTSFRSQISSVFRHPLKRDLYIALADRWLPDLSPSESNRESEFDRIFSGDATVSSEMPDVDTSRADYVWLPLAFDERGIPTLEWRDEWTIEEYE